VPSLGHVKDTRKTEKRRVTKKMNKKILVSIMIMSFASGLVGAGTMAYWNKIVPIGTVTFTTGSIDIGDQKSWTSPLYLRDIKPCYTYHENFTVTNTGDNPVNIYKNITVTTDGKSIAQYILYDLWVQVYVKNATGQWNLFWHQGIYNETVTIHDVDRKWIYLGMLPQNENMTVIESYHMKPDTPNTAEGATMSMDITVDGEQLTGHLTLEHKNTTNNAYLILHDGYNGSLTYNMVGPTFSYSFTGKAPLSSTTYYLIYYADPYPGNHPGALLGSGITDASGSITLNGSVNTGSLPNPSDGNYPYGAKIWLVSDYNPATNSLTAWNPANYLFETGLIVYTKG
jgi:hypothetical protein